MQHNKRANKLFTSKLKKILFAVLCVFMAVTVIVFIVYSIFLSSLFNKTNPYNVHNTPGVFTQYTLEHEGVLYERNNDVHGILLMGLQQQEPATESAPYQADTIYLMTINKKTDEIHLLNIPRELHSTLFFTGENGEIVSTAEGHICNVNAYANDSLSIEPLNGGLFTCASLSHELFDTQIERFISIDMDIVTDVVHLMGGIEVPITPFFAQQFQIPTQDTVRVGDESLEFYLRYRDTSLPDGGLAERQERQRAFINAFIDEIFTNFAEISFIEKMLDLLLPAIKTDLSLNETLYIVLKFYTASYITFDTLIGETKDSYFYMQEDAAKEYIRELYYVPVK